MQKRFGSYLRTPTQSELVCFSCSFFFFFFSVSLSLARSLVRSSSLLFVCFYFLFLFNLIAWVLFSIFLSIFDWARLKSVPVHNSLDVHPHHRDHQLDYVYGNANVAPKCRFIRNSVYMHFYNKRELCSNAHTRRRRQIIKKKLIAEVIAWNVFEKNWQNRECLWRLPGIVLPMVHTYVYQFQAISLFDIFHSICFFCSLSLLFISFLWKIVSVVCWKYLNMDHHCIRIITLYEIIYAVRSHSTFGSVTFVLNGVCTAWQKWRKWPLFEA